MSVTEEHILVLVIAIVGILKEVISVSVILASLEMDCLFVKVSPRVQANPTWCGKPHTCMTKHSWSVLLCLVH